MVDFPTKALTQVIKTIYNIHSYEHLISSLHIHIYTHIHINTHRHGYIRSNISKYIQFRCTITYVNKHLLRPCMYEYADSSISLFLILLLSEEGWGNIPNQGVSVYGLEEKFIYLFPTVKKTPSPPFPF